MRLRRFYGKIEQKNRQLAWYPQSGALKVIFVQFLPWKSCGHTRIPRTCESSTHKCGANGRVVKIAGPLLGIRVRMGLEQLEQGRLICDL